MTYTKETLAALLNGREYGSEITRQEEKDAKASGLVVLFGYSDDNAEFRGSVNDEVGCYGGGTLLIDRNGPLLPHDDCNCNFCGYAEVKAKATKIEAVWSKGDCSWQYETAIPHATFDIMEDDEKFCRGIVFALSDLPTA